MQSIRSVLLLLVVLWGTALSVVFLFSPASAPVNSAANPVVAAQTRSLPSTEEPIHDGVIEPDWAATVSEAEGPMEFSPAEATRPAKAIVVVDSKPVAVVKAVPVVAELTPDEKMAQLLSKRVDLTDPVAREELVAEIRRLEEESREITKRRAAAMGLPLVTTEGAVLSGFKRTEPLYDIDHNEKAAKSTAADQVRDTAPYLADGGGFAIGLWEVGDIPLLTHVEYAGRVFASDVETTYDTHASHVAGTLIAEGQNSTLLGMSPAATIKAHNSDFEISEMTALAASAAGQTDKIYLSNHSYGASIGWNDASDRWYGTYLDDPFSPEFHAASFGRYSSTAASYDGLAYNSRYFLIFKSSGNDGNDYAPTDGATWYLGSSSISFTYDSSLHPAGDDALHVDGAEGRFGTIGHRGSAKNIITVGSVSDAVTSSARDPGAANVSVFSSAGPTDDGRIKPDLVANGEIVKSCASTSNTATANYSGTSMATPNACGSSLLLMDYYEQVTQGQMMWASTLKGLLIHTADDVGNPGPDYKCGWGLMNVKAAADLITEHFAYGNEARMVESALSDSFTQEELTVNHDGNGPLRVTICWTDPAGSWTSSHDSRAARLVNDLNLVVTGPGGTHYPYVMPYVGDWSDSKLNDNAVTGVNNVDNVEQVYIAAPVAGEYTIRIDYDGALASNSQEYSVLVSGASVVVGPPVVRVDAPVGDMIFVGHNTNPILAVADVNTVFTGTGHSYDASVSPAGIITASINPDGTVDLMPTTTQFGTASVTLTATDAFSNVAVDSFDVTIAAPVLYVDASVDPFGVPMDGFSWGTAYRHLQDALAASMSGQQIWVAQGVYHPDEGNGISDGDQAVSFALKTGVSMYGGFAPGALSLAEAQPKIYSTHLSGDISLNDGAMPGSYAGPQPLPAGAGTSTSSNTLNVLDLSACDATAVVDGFIVSGGYADFQDVANGVYVYYGGGIFSDGGSATISRCQIAGNYANQRGGGVYFEGGALKLIDCLISGNRVGLNGGGLWAESATVVVQACEFRGNISSYAGGLGMNGGSVQVANCLISGGKGFFGSGGVQIQTGELSLVNCTVTGNYCSTSGGGLRVAAAGSNVTVDNCIFRNNQAGEFTGTAKASIHFDTLANPPVTPPTVTNSLIDFSGGSGGWDYTIAFDGGGNIQGDPQFFSPVNPTSQGSEAGDYHLLATSPSLNTGSQALVSLDICDLDNDGDASEPVPFDLEGSSRVASLGVDMGPYEFSDLGVLDVDLDGLSDEFELANVGNVIDLVAGSDHDGDGLTALAEFVHGLDPNMPLTEPVGRLSMTNHNDQDYLTVTYEVDPAAESFVQVDVMRVSDLELLGAGNAGETVLLSRGPSAGNPGLDEVVERSVVPMDLQDREFFRIRHQQIVPAP